MKPRTFDDLMRAIVATQYRIAALVIPVYGHPQADNDN